MSLVFGGILAFSALVFAVQVESSAHERSWPLSAFSVVRADTDTVDVATEEAIRNALRAARSALDDDSTVAGADTTDGDSLRLSNLYFPSARRESFLAPLTTREERPFRVNYGP
ncbi:MAG: hypothetical protein R3284_10610, partial [Rubricoccaceae bacterium]|nr:hypothetical protein [Rubricoccaceae bacterium]